jgi:hypothetical protein
MNFSYGNEFDVQTPKKTSTPKTAAENLNNTSGLGTSFGLGTYDKDTNSYQGGFFDPDGFDYGAALGGTPGKYVVTPYKDLGSSNFGDDSNPAYSAKSAITLLDPENLTQEQAQAELKKIGPTVSGSGGDYSDLSSFDNYNFGGSPYDLDYFKKIAEAAGGGKKTQSASDLNVMSGAGPNTFRYDPDNPPEDEGEGVDNGGGGGDSGGGGGETPIPVPVYDLVKPTPYVTPLPPDFDSGFTGIKPPNKFPFLGDGEIVTFNQNPQTSMITPPTSQYTASMLSEATPTLSSEQLMGLGTDEEQSLAELLSLLDNNTSVG